MTSWIRGVISNAESTAPPSKTLSLEDIAANKMQRVNTARARLVMAEAEHERARIEYEESRYDLARHMANYGLASTVDGNVPPPAREDDDD
jgi:hypothetical protein